jgi:hypothetical protein
MVAQDLIQTASGDDAQRLKRSMRAFKSALAWGMGVLDYIGQHCKWPPTVKSELANRVSEMTKAPLEFAVDADGTNLVGNRMQCPRRVGQDAGGNDASRGDYGRLEPDGLPGVLRGPRDEPGRGSHGAGGVSARAVKG